VPHTTPLCDERAVSALVILFFFPY
jgi:hypothetical protein